MTLRTLSLALTVILAGSCAVATNAAGKTVPARDIMWVWAITAIEDGKPQTAATYAEAGPLERCRLLGLKNIIMAGLGLPDNYEKARSLTKAVSKAPRLVWEITADDEVDPAKPRFRYDNRLSVLRPLIDQFPKIEAVVLDDMSSVGIDHGFKPEHIRAVRDLLPGKYGKQVKLWGVLYTMNFDRPNIADYIKEIDVITLAIWKADELPQMEASIDRCRSLFPGKPIVLGLYMYDYGAGRRMPLDLMKLQYDTALKLAKDGRIQGIIFVSISDDANAVNFTADWIRKAGRTRIPVAK